MSKKTIAIIGAADNVGGVIAKNLAKNDYRLLLFAHKAAELTSLVKRIKKETPTSDITSMNCEADASWEADVIISTISLNKEIAIKIQPFVNRKILIWVSSDVDDKGSSLAEEIERVQQLLPGANLLFVSSLTGKTGRITLIATVDEDVLQVAKQILKAAGFSDIQWVNYKNSLLELI